MKIASKESNNLLIHLSVCHKDQYLPQIFCSINQKIDLVGVKRNFAMFIAYCYCYRYRLVIIMWLGNLCQQIFYWIFLLHSLRGKKANI